MLFLIVIIIVLRCSSAKCNVGHYTTQDKKSRARYISSSIDNVIAQNCSLSTELVIYHRLSLCLN